MAKPPLVVSYGVGVDSTALLVGLRRLGRRPDMIVFADTGSERPETYAYLATMQQYLARVGFPPVVVVRAFHSEGLYGTLYDKCIVNRTLPSVAFNQHSCSIDFKAEPITAQVNRMFGRQTAVIRAIGYDNGDADSARVTRWEKAAKHDDRLKRPDEFWYPLREWEWDRARCMAEIAAERLPVPLKSSCFFCSNMRPSEVRSLVADHPVLADMIIAMETNAAPYNIKTEGLWRHKRVTDGKPGSMGDFIHMLRSGQDVSRIVDVLPKKTHTARLAGAGDDVDDLGCLL